MIYIIGFNLSVLYIYDILLLKKGDRKYHVKKLELTLNKMKETLFKCNIKKSFFGKTEIEYLGFWVTHDGLKPIDKNRSNKNMKTPNP